MKSVVSRKPLVKSNSIPSNPMQRSIVLFQSAIKSKKPYLNPDLSIFYGMWNL